jgi:magnesium-transporting ATPase (P-type)
MNSPGHSICIKTFWFGLGVSSLPYSFNSSLVYPTSTFCGLLTHCANDCSAPYWYYYMAIVNTVVRITGGLVVAVFQYMSDMSLYQLVVTEGTAMVLRGGEMVTMDQTEIVPGDIVRLVVGEAMQCRSNNDHHQF